MSAAATVPTVIEVSEGGGIYFATLTCDGEPAICVESFYGSNWKAHWRRKQSKDGYIEFLGMLPIAIDEKSEISPDAVTQFLENRTEVIRKGSGGNWGWVSLRVKDTPHARTVIAELISKPASEAAKMLPKPVRVRTEQNSSSEIDYRAVLADLRARRDVLSQAISALIASGLVEETVEDEDDAR